MSGEAFDVAVVGGGAGPRTTALHTLGAVLALAAGVTAAIVVVALGRSVT